MYLYQAFLGQFGEVVHVKVAHRCIIQPSSSSPPPPPPPSSSPSFQSGVSKQKNRQIKALRLRRVQI
jgi:hypothetical protein